MALPDPALVTDDTQMTLALGRGLRTALGRGAAHRAAPRGARARGVRRPGGARPTTTGRRAAPASGPAQLLSAPERPWAEAAPDRVQGLRRQHAGRADRARTRAEPAAALRRRAAPVRADPRAPHRARRQRSDRLRRARPRRRRPPAELPGLLRTYAHDHRTVYREDWLGDLWRRSQDPSAADVHRPRLGRVPRRAGPAGGGARAHRTRRPTPAWPPAPAGSRRRRWPPACCASCSSPTSRSPRCAGPPAPPATPTRSPASPAPSRAPTSGAGAWPEEWAARIEYRDELLALGEAWDA